MNTKNRLVLLRSIEGSIRSLLEPILKNHINTIRHGIGKGFKVKGCFFPSLFYLVRGEDLTAEERFLLSLDLRQKTIYDIGAYIGIYTMFFARSAGDAGNVVAFEPNPQNCVKLRGNVSLNNLHNVRVMEIGLGEKEETKTLVVPRYSDAMGSVNEARAFVLKEWRSKCFKVEIQPLDIVRARYNLPRPHFVKVDVEGAEYDVLLGMKNTISECKPSLLLEINGVDGRSKIENVRNILGFLGDYAYSFHSVESGKMISNKSPSIAQSGHIFAICVS